jgi:hypothetical protein
MANALEANYTVVWPRSPRQTRNKTFAKRPASLAGKKIAFLWDYLFRGDEVFTVLQQAIQERHPDAEFVSWTVFGNTHGSDERRILKELPQRLQELKVDAVISGMAA